MATRIVLFDLGNVVLDWQPLRLYRQRFDDPAEADRFVAEVCTMDWHKAHDRGVPMAENAKALIAAYPHYEGHIRAWGEEWMETFHGYVPGMPALIARLEEARRPLYALSNMPAETVRATIDGFPMLKVFRDIVVSGVEGVIKPDREIYDIALARMGLPDPDDVLFVDDREENVDAAVAIGMKGHMFVSSSVLAEELLKLGLLSPD
ncbi:MAG: HAD family phosphatase [Pseudomonadota bacterium]